MASLDSQGNRGASSNVFERTPRFTISDEEERYGPGHIYYLSVG